MRRYLGRQVMLLLPFLAFLLFWEIAARCVERGQYFYGSPSIVAHHLWNRALSGSLFVDIYTTGLEAILGFLIGTVLGTTLGITLGYWPKVARVAQPYVIGLGVIPIFAIAPILIIWFGIGLTSKIAMASLSTIFVATFQAYEGVRNVDGDYVFLMRTMGSTRWQLFRHVVLPSAAVWVLAGARLNVGFAILGAFLGEVIASDHGLGQMIINATGLFNIPVAMAGVVGLCMLALVLVLCCTLIERALLPWRKDVVITGEESR